MCLDQTQEVVLEAAMEDDLLPAEWRVECC